MTSSVCVKVIFSDSRDGVCKSLFLYLYVTNKNGKHLVVVSKKADLVVGMKWEWLWIFHDATNFYFKNSNKLILKIQ